MPNFCRSPLLQLSHFCNCNWLQLIFSQKTFLILYSFLENSTTGIATTTMRGRRKRVGRVGNCPPTFWWTKSIENLISFILRFPVLYLHNQILTNHKTTLYLWLFKIVVSRLSKISGKLLYTLLQMFRQFFLFMM